MFRFLLRHRPYHDILLHNRVYARAGKVRQADIRDYRNFLVD